MDTRTMQALPRSRSELGVAVPAEDVERPAMGTRAIAFSVGILLAAAGVASLINAGLGAGPGDVMIGALAMQIGVSHGTAAQATQAAFVLVAVSLGRRPGPGTIASALLLGPTINLALQVVPTPGSMPLRVVAAAMGLVAMGIGVGLTISARFGPSTGELWSDAVSRRLSMDKQHVRWWLEATMIGIGFMFGGPVGLLTLVVAVSIGPLIDTGTRLGGGLPPALARVRSVSARQFSRF